MRHLTNPPSYRPYLNLGFRVSRIATLCYLAAWGCFTLYYWILAYLLHASTTQAINAIPILFIPGIIFFITLTRSLLTPALTQRTAPTPSKYKPSRTDTVLVILAATLPLIGVSVDLARLGGGYLAALIFAGLGIVAAARYGAILYTTPQTPDQSFRFVKTLEAGAFLIITAAVVIGITATIRPDADDAYYLNIIANALAHPDLPMQNTDVLLGTGTGEPVHPGYRSSSYEIAVALFSHFLGLDYLLTYYTIFPLITGLAWIAAAYLFAHSLGLRLPMTCVAIVTGLLLLWGGHNHAFGNFAFVRLFQGKAAVALLAVPLIYTSVLYHIRAPGLGTWLLLMLALVTVGGFSTSGLIIGPVALFLASMAFLPLARESVGRLATLSTAAIPLLLVLAANVLATLENPIPPGVSSGELEFDGEAFGGMQHKLLVLVTLVWAPLAARLTGRTSTARLLFGLSVVGLLTVFNPLFVRTLVGLSGIDLLSWRLQWAFPSVYFPAFFFTIALCRLTFHPRPADQRERLVTFGLLGGAVLLAGWFLATTVPTKAVALNPIANIGQPKIPADYLDEMRAVRAMLPGSQALVAVGIGEEILPRLPSPPAFVSVRHYLDFYEGKLPDETMRLRRGLQKVLVELHPVQDESTGQLLNAAWAAEAAKRLGVQGVAFSSGRLESGLMAPEAADPQFILELKRYFEQTGYRCTLTRSGWTWVCVRKP